MPDGEINFLSRVKALDWSCLDKALDPEHANVVGAKALEECVVLYVQKDYFIRCLEENGRFALWILKYAINNISHMSTKSDRLIFSDAREHMLYYILDYWNRNSMGKAQCKIEMALGKSWFFWEEDCNDKDPVRLPRHHLNQLRFSLENHDKSRFKCRLLPIYYFFEFRYDYNNRKSSPEQEIFLLFGTAFCLSAVLSETCFKIYEHIFQCATLRHNRHGSCYPI